MQRFEISAYIVLFMGVGLLVFTFVEAYVILTEPMNVLGSSYMTEAFGVALGPLIVASIRVMFLAVMGWVGSVLTMRGVQLLAQIGRESKQGARTEGPATTKPGDEEARSIEDPPTKETGQKEGK